MAKETSCDRLTVFSTFSNCFSRQIAFLCRAARRWRWWKLWGEGWSYLALDKTCQNFMVEKTWTFVGCVWNNYAVSMESSMSLAEVWLVSFLTSLTALVLPQCYVLICFVHVFLQDWFDYSLFWSGSAWMVDWFMSLFASLVSICCPGVLAGWDGEAYWIPDPKPHPDYETYVQMLLGSLMVQLWANRMHLICP